MTATCWSCSALVVFSTTPCSASTIFFLLLGEHDLDLQLRLGELLHLLLLVLGELLLGDLAEPHRLGDLLGRLDRGDRDGEDLDSLLLAVRGQALDQVALEFLAVVAADELAARSASSRRSGRATGSRG